MAKVRIRTGAVYRKAAALVESGYQLYSCNAVDEAYYGNRTTDGVSPHRTAYEDLFGRTVPWAPDERRRCWVADFLDAGGRNFRVTALCFMAAIADAGDLPVMSTLVACLEFSSDEYGTLIVPDTERSRRDAITMLFGDPPFEASTGAEGFLRGDDLPEKLIVRRCMHSQQYIDNLPEWEP